MLLTYRLIALVKDLVATNDQLQQFGRSASGKNCTDDSQVEHNSAIVALVTHGAGGDRSWRSEFHNACTESEKVFF